MQTPAPTELIHVHDPMCSWCWAFRPVWLQLRAQLPADMAVRRVVGGLAPDSDVPMDAAMRAKLQSIWQTIQAQVPGTRFNFDFWTHCTPRRSTYNACRAVLAAKQLNPAAEDRMVLAIQEAYYLQAQNTSDISTLVQVAQSVGLDADAFTRAMVAPETQSQLEEELGYAHRLPINGFPCLVPKTPTGLHRIDIDYLDAAPMLLQINNLYQIGH
jgi:putative protein-disulfide isomerase